MKRTLNFENGSTRAVSHAPSLTEHHGRFSFFDARFSPAIASFSHM
jgi:hypothetical protein